MRQLTIDGRQEDVVIGRNVQDHLFTAPQTMKGQLPMPEPEPHRCKILQDMDRGGHARCVTCGWEGSWRRTCVDAAQDAEDHQDYYSA